MTENSLNICLSYSQFLDKMQQLIQKLPKRYANCELRTANSNPEKLTVCIFNALY